ncbi:CHC2 zinc finger domain-containing protein [Crenobacter caeni]|uniref:Zinc finger CHC2-type domain-containing protein n=1 Tax=Crenobacter caeni TaxID=2705474 RepID=A0A6B2KTI4_9NEIS|nr:CHC2 zinc finger domain-containing protein [Crenobacter caeni]NDV13542.1 hypothetical protein [Crenobacter caeni]
MGIRVLVATLCQPARQTAGRPKGYPPVGPGQFCREYLPAPEDYYTSHFGDAMRRSGKGWQVRCLFHDDRTPSATVYPDGGFHCHACGVHCRDVLDFHMRMTGLGFKQAAQALGAWGASQ